MRRREEKKLECRLKRRTFPFSGIFQPTADKKNLKFSLKWGGGREVPGFSLKLGLKSLVILTALNKPS